MKEEKEQRKLHNILNDFLNLATSHLSEQDKGKRSGLNLSRISKNNFLMIQPRTKPLQEEKNPPSHCCESVSECHVMLVAL